MVMSHVIFYGWNRSIPGREQTTAAHFQEFLVYAGGLQDSGAIESFEVVFLSPHGGDMIGFFLIKGDQAQLDALQASDEYRNHVTRGAIHLEGSGEVRGVTGEEVMEWQSRWAGNLPG
jgi:hypothetical protein